MPIKGEILGNICNLLPYAIVATDPDSKVIYWNDSAERIFKYSKQEALGQEVHKLLAPPHLLHKIKPTLHQFKLTGTGSVVNKTIEITALTKDKKYIPVELSLYAFEIDHKWYSAAIIQDITERKKKERELTQAKELTEQALRLKTEFISNISHELRTPLNGIMGMSELLSYTSLDEEQQKYLHHIRASAETLLKLIESLLDFSKLQAGATALQAVEFNLKNLIEEVCSDFASAISTKNLNLYIKISDDIPALLLGDVKVLKTILTNLIDNSIKFTEIGSITIKAELNQCQDNQAFIHFSIIDTGMGISADKQELIFEPFAQADGSASRIYQGVGMGLTIAKSLINKMGGWIWLQSEEGKGSEFHFLLAFKVKQYTHSLKDAQAVNYCAIKGLTVLVVDDTEINQALLSRLLGKKGLNVISAYSAQEAINYFKQGGIDVILMDIHMPGLDGYATTKLIREHEKLTGTRTPIFIMSAINETSIDSEFLHTYTDGYIPKPININTLLQEINKVIKPQSPDRDI